MLARGSENSRVARYWDATEQCYTAGLFSYTGDGYRRL